MERMDSPYLGCIRRECRICIGWMEFGTVSGADLSAVFVLSVVSWQIDTHVYDL